MRILLKSALRDRISLFWSAVLPVGLLIGLGVVFDSPEYRGRLLAGAAALVLAVVTFRWDAEGRKAPANRARD